jgi:hypothetical protein
MTPAPEGRWQWSDRGGRGRLGIILLAVLLILLGVQSAGWTHFSHDFFAAAYLITAGVLLVVLFL